MKISCLPVSLFPDFEQNRYSVAEWARDAKRIGLDGIDISIVHVKNHTPAYLSRLKEQLKAEGIPVVMATTYPDFTHPSREQRDRELDYLKRDIALCDELGIRYLRVLAGQAHPGVQREGGVRHAIEYLKRAGEFARKYSTKLLFENHAKPSAWNHFDFSFPLDVFMQVFEGIRDTGIRLNFDIGNVVALGFDPLDVYEKLKDWVETVHISDMKEKGKFAPAAIGEGVAPIRQFLDILKGQRFDGWISIEEASGNGVEGIENALKFVKNGLS